MSGFSLRLFYPLLHVFDETGRAMHGNSWSGAEAWARDFGDPDVTKQERRAIIEALNALPEREHALAQIAVDQSDYEAVQAQGEKFQAIYAEREKLYQELHDLPEVHDTWIKDHEAFQRRLTVEATLRDAFKQGDLTLLFGPSTVVEWERWANSTDFRVYFCLSMIRAPKNQYFGTRRAAALIKQVEFDEWIKRFGVLPEANGSLTPKAQCINWLRAEIAKGKRYERDEYQHMALATIAGLSGREFKRVWANEVPAHWKNPGPLRKR